MILTMQEKVFIVEHCFHSYGVGHSQVYCILQMNFVNGSKIHQVNVHHPET